MIANDIVVTHNWFDNLLICAEGIGVFVLISTDSIKRVYRDKYKSIYAWNDTSTPIFMLGLFYKNGGIFIDTARN